MRRLCRGLLGVKFFQHRCSVAQRKNPCSLTRLLKRDFAGILVSPFHSLSKPELEIISALAHWHKLWFRNLPGTGGRFSRTADAGTFGQDAVRLIREQHTLVPVFVKRSILWSMPKPARGQLRGQTRCALKSSKRFQINEISFPTSGYASNGSGINRSHLES
jgi:hypothetical protein